MEHHVSVEAQPNPVDDTWFVVQVDDCPPAVCDPAALAAEVTRVVEALHYGWDSHELRVWRWLGEGALEPLTVVWKDTQRGLEWDALDFAYPVWTVTGPDGHEHLTVAVRIDGRC